MQNPSEKARTSDITIVSVPSIAWWRTLKALPNFSTMYLETSRQPCEEDIVISARIDLVPDGSILDESWWFFMSGVLNSV